MDDPISADSVVVLYLGGEGRSGSTIISTMLGNHRGFFPVGEFRDIWQALRTNELCGCGASFARCEFWSRVGERAFGSWDCVDLESMLKNDQRFARQRRVPRLLLSSLRWIRSTDLSSYRQILAKLYTAIQVVSGCSVIVDSTKDPAYALLLSKVPGVDLRVVHLVRDSRGVAHSWGKKRVERPEYARHPTLRGTFMGNRSSWRTALEWDMKNMLFHCLKLSPLRERVRYEAIATETTRELARILKLADEGRVSLGGEMQPCQEFESTAFHTVGGNRVRFNRGTVRLLVDDEWKSKMPRAQRLVVGALTLPLLIAYGYVGRFGETAAVKKSRR